jgi:hypothetical protein
MRQVVLRLIEKGQEQLQGAAASSALLSATLLPSASR